jgi:transglutaminase-like putative cysteine protease
MRNFFCESLGNRGRAAAAGCVLAMCIGVASAQEHAVQEQPAAQQEAGETVERVVREDWYRLEMMGGRAGWMRTQESERAGKIITRSEVSLSFSRAMEGAKIVMRGEFVETAGGKPVSMRSTQQTGKMVVDQFYVFETDGVSVVTTQAGKESTRRADLPVGEWTTPAATERAMLEKFRAGEKTITARTLDPQMGLKVVTQTRTGFEPAKITLDDKEVEAIRTEVETDVVPGVKSVEFIDGEGELLRNETTIGGISVVMTRTTRERAMDESGSDAPEVMISTFVKPTGRRIENPRRTTSGVYLLSMEEGELPELPQSGVQRVKPIDARRARVAVIPGRPADALDGDATDKRFRQPSSALDSTDVKVIEIVKTALLDEPTNNPAQRAELLRRAVHTHIRKKNLGVGMATASEVARTGEGDCSEHAVLLAACLRADDIPSSVVTGLLYVDEFAGKESVFGYHMWTRALVGAGEGMPGRWIDLDATLPDDTPSDATHIALGVSSLSDEESLESLMGVAGVMGRLKIEVEAIAPSLPKGRTGESK